MHRRKATAVRGGSSQDGRRDDLLGRRIGAEATSQPHRVQAVYDGQHFCGFVLARGELFEAFDRDEKSLGTFTTQGAGHRRNPCRGGGVMKPRRQQDAAPRRVFTLKLEARRGRDDIRRLRALLKLLLRRHGFRCLEAREEAER